MNFVRFLRSWPVNLFRDVKALSSTRAQAKLTLNLNAFSMFCGPWFIPAWNVIHLQQLFYSQNYVVNLLILFHLLVACSLSCPFATIILFTKLCCESAYLFYLLSIMFLFIIALQSIDSTACLNFAFTCILFKMHIWFMILLKSLFRGFCRVLICQVSVFGLKCIFYLCIYLKGFVKAPVLF